MSKEDKKTVNVRLEISLETHAKLIELQKEVKDKYKVKVSIPNLLLYNIESTKDFKFKFVD